MAQTVKTLPAIQETRVQSLGQEDPLEAEMATRSSILAWRIPWTEEPDGLQPMGSQTVRHNLVTSTVSLFWNFSPWDFSLPEHLTSHFWADWTGIYYFLHINCRVTANVFSLWTLPVFPFADTKPPLLIYQMQDRLLYTCVFRVLFKHLFPASQSQP